MGLPRLPAASRLRGVPPRTAPDPALALALRELRAASGLTQEALAHEAGMTVAGYAGSKRGKSTPRGRRSPASPRRFVSRTPRWVERSTHTPSCPRPRRLAVGDAGWPDADGGL